MKFLLGFIVGVVISSVAVGQLLDILGREYV